MIKKIVIYFLALLGLILLYLFFWPVPIDPVAWTPQEIPSLTGVYAPNSKLAGVKRLEIGKAFGPEDIAVDRQGRIYTGVDDGRILRLQSDGGNPEVFSNTGGRPLGLEFDLNDNLIVADGIKGLLSIDPNGKVAVLTAEVNGTQINFADDLDIARDGIIYFSDASSKFSYNDALLDWFELRPNGRLLSYDPGTGETKVLLKDLYFANGVAVSPDQSFVLINETWKYRVRRYWIEGPGKGQSDVFIDNLPGSPDNITCNGKDIFWLALFSGPEARSEMDTMLSRPFVRKIILRLPESLRTVPMAHVGYVLGLGIDAGVVYNLQDPTGKAYAFITSVTEHEGTLYLGSVFGDALGSVPVP
jgi:sugar lactone lactonase YvrE